MEFGHVRQECKSGVDHSGLHGYGTAGKLPSGQLTLPSADEEEKDNALEDPATANASISLTIPRGYCASGGDRAEAIHRSSPGLLLLACRG